MREDIMLGTWALKDERSYKEVINIRIPWRAKKILAKVAKSKGMTLSDFVRLCIERALEEELNGNKPTHPDGTPLGPAEGEG